ncbi:MAG: AMP-binding protein, partial [Acidimicrobiia bacterium]|nr:AMP-binding protein [Acidimicrobiia bacterium]
MPTRAEYEELRRSFRLEVPDHFNYVRDVLYDRAHAHPHDLALVAVEPDGLTARRFDFAAIAARVTATAAVLASLGVTTGDRVFLMLPRIVQWYDVLLGCLHLGAVPMPATMQLSARDVTYRVNVDDATTVVTDTVGMAAVGAALPECPGVSRRVLVGGAAAGWTNLDVEVAGAPTSTPVHATAAAAP